MCSVSVGKPNALVRIDLTDGGDYTISEATRTVIGELAEPLEPHLLQRRQEKLKPLIPQVRDMLKEYSAIGGERVQISSQTHSRVNDSKRR